MAHTPCTKLGFSMLPNGHVQVRVTSPDGTRKVYEGEHLGVSFNGLVWLGNGPVAAPGEVNVWSYEGSHFGGGLKALIAYLKEKEIKFAYIQPDFEDFEDQIREDKKR